MITLCSVCHEYIEKVKSEDRTRKDVSGWLYERFIQDIEPQDQSLGGTKDLCVYAVIEQAWGDWLIRRGLPEFLITRKCPKQTTQAHFRDIRLRKLLRMKAEGKKRAEIIKAGISKSMTDKYLNHPEIAEQILETGFGPGKGEES